MSMPVISAAQMREWEEASWAAGRSQAEVIRGAGRAVASAALRLTCEGDRVLILAGKGHNGDDARAAQPHLLNRKVRLLNVQDPAADLGGLESLLARRPALVIDGLFGIGLSRPLDAAWTGLIERINRARLPVLAVDLPSGLDADSGEPRPAAVRARATLTFGAVKRGLLAPASWRFAGRVELAGEIGLVACPFAEEWQWTLPEDFADYPPPRPVEGHKGTFGHAVIVAGSPGYHGAAVLAARGAMQARPGLISVVCEARTYVPVASQLQAAMVHAGGEPLALPAGSTAVVVGPGLAAGDLGPGWQRFAREQWRSSALPVVMDASALDWIEPGAAPVPALRVLTPHPGEAARLLGAKPDEVQADRVAALREISKRYGDCWVVLKGHQTIAGKSTGEIFFNSSGNPFLAQGGAGDILAGFLGGLLAQPALQGHPLQAIRYAVWAHGEAADRLSAGGAVWQVERLPEALGG